MKMSKVLAGIFALAMVGAMFTSCGSKKEESSVEESPASTSAPSDESETEEETEAETEEEEEEEDEPELAELEKLEIPAKEEKSPELEEVGTISGDSFRFTSDLIYTSDGENVTIYDYMGKEFEGGKISNVSKLGDTGLFACYVAEGDIPYERLITAEGEVIVDTDEKVGLFKELNDKFLIAYFPEATTTDEDKAIYYVTANQFSITPNGEDVLYTGKVKVYDIESGKFLENTTIEESPNYRVTGDIISFYNEDGDKVYVSSEDKVFDVDSNYDAQGSRFFTCYSGGKYQVFDHDLNLVMESEKTVQGMDGTDYYVKIYDPDNRVAALADYNLTEITDCKYSFLSSIDGTMFQYGGEDSSTYGLLSADGKEITEAQYKLISAVKTPGYYACKKDDGTYDLVSRDGKVVDSGSSDGYYEFASKKDGDGYATLVANTGEFSIKSESTLENFGSGIGYDSRAHILYDIYTGDKLAEDFDKAYKAYDHIYIVKGSEIKVYSVK